MTRALTYLGVLAAAVGITGCAAAAWSGDTVHSIGGALLALAGSWLIRALTGTCKACGHPATWLDPLTVVRSPRVHRRHMPNIRASHRRSR